VPDRTKTQRRLGHRAVGSRRLLYRPGTTAIHRLPPEVKIACTVAFVLVVVATPSTARWAFAAYGAMLLGICALVRVPPSWLLPRMALEVPFVVFAVLLPFLAAGERTTFLGLAVSASGLESAFGILVKGTTGVVASLLLAATTDLRELLAGLHRLHVPAPLVQIMTFMLRYADVVVGEMERMRVARAARCFEARTEGRLRLLGAAAAVLFVRAYERGERVHLAMLARGYTGGRALLDGDGATPVQWASGAVLPLCAAAVAAVAWTMQ
jgi:cobalt/nickel transport system permease protein